MVDRHQKMLAALTVHSLCTAKMTVPRREKCASILFSSVAKIANTAKAHDGAVPWEGTTPE